MNDEAWSRVAWRNVWDEELCIVWQRAWLQIHCPQGIRRDLSLGTDDAG
jgi:hypothetical protein